MPGAVRDVSTFLKFKTIKKKNVASVFWYCLPIRQLTPEVCRRFYENIRHGLLGLHSNWNPYIRAPTLFRCFFSLSLSIQASVNNNLTVTIPSDYLVQGSTYSFMLRVENMFGGAAEAEATVFKSSQELLALKVGRQKRRGSYTLPNMRKL